MDVAAQESEAGSYRPPVFNRPPLYVPPHTTITLPVQIAELVKRGEGASPVEMGVQLSLEGSYRPPSPGGPGVDWPPQTSMRPPVHTASWLTRAPGALLCDVGVQLSASGSYRPPELVPFEPAQTIIRDPVQTAE